MYVKTKRLLLKPIEKADLGSLVELLMDATVGKTYMVPDFSDKTQAEKLAERIMVLSEDPGRNVAGIFRKNQLIGLLNQTEVCGSSVEVGYAVLPQFQGQGYATEALTGAIEDFFVQGFEEVVAGAFEHNAASIRVMCKSGMTQLDRQEVISYKGKEHLCLYYAVRKPANV